MVAVSRELISEVASHLSSSARQKYILSQVLVVLGSWIALWVAGARGGEFFRRIQFLREAG